VEIKIKWIPRKQMTHENTYRDNTSPLFGQGTTSFFLAHLAFRPCELLTSLFVRRLSVNISHFNLLLRNHWANCNQTLVEWSLDGPVPKMCPVIPTSNQDGHQAKNRKKGGDEILIVHCCFSISQNELKF
jgi:hypothetical protein